MRTVLFSCVAALALSGCAKKPLVTDVSGVSAGRPIAPPTQYAEGDAAYDKRDTKEGNDEAIRLYEAALAADPDRDDWREIKVRLGGLYYNKGIWWDRDLSKKELMPIFWAGKEHACDAMRAEEAFATAMDDGMKIKEASQLVTADGADAMYWCAVDWATWGQNKGLLRVALDIPKVKAMMDRLLVISEDYAFGGVHRFFGAFYVEIPAFAGQSEETSKMHYDRSLELFPEWPENLVEYAKYHPVFVGDREKFEALLNKLMALEVPTDPAYRAEFLIAQGQGQQLLDQADELFAE